MHSHLPAETGWSMRFGTNKTNKTPYSYYACSYYGQFGKGNCSMHYIRYDVLYQAVLERLQYWAKAVQQDEEKVLNKIQKAGNAERIREKKKKASTLKKAENRQNEIDRLFASCMRIFSIMAFNNGAVSSFGTEYSLINSIHFSAPIISCSILLSSSLRLVICCSSSICSFWYLLDNITKFRSVIFSQALSSYIEESRKQTK